ncbi:MAG: glycine betaine/proline transport system permease protein, partial [Verrucomicrobiales bacterium]
MGYVLAQDSFLDNTWPESFRFPFGEWLKELVFWGVNNPITSFLGEVVEWPFKTFFELIMSERVGRDSIMTIPWVWLVIAVFVVASFTRNTRIGLASASMLAACGFLGAEYWTETAKTIGMILVSVTLCAIVGIPLGIMSGRFDSVWNVVRPALDAMQVVHSFVFMLPFIFFFGLGNVSATMVTMVFALPPLVRLTNLGIRQVPEDVVEASRAYGATELRVLTDVQLPLARPAIMTGLNQTLLLAISMLGIAALMGAGGLGRLLFRAINNLNLGLAASAGLAFFLVAVILDRISQTEAQDGVRMSLKIKQAFTYRADPEGLLAAQEAQAATPEPVEPSERPAPVTSGERTGLMIAAAGSAVAVISLFLPWANDAGLASSYGRLVDESLPGLSFNGYQASGGTFFGIIMGLFAILALLAAIRPLLSFNASIGRLMLKGQGFLLAGISGLILLVWLMNIFDIGTGPLGTIGLWMFAVTVLFIAIETFTTGTARLGSDGALIAAIGMLGAALGYALLQPTDFVQNYSHGIGVYVALIGSVIAVGGAAMATLSAPYGPRRPLPGDIAWVRVGGAVFAVLLVVGAALGVGKREDADGGWGWYFDARVETIQRSSADVPPDIEAEVQRLKDDAGDDINKQIANAQAIQNLINSVQRGDKIIFSGVDSQGPQLGIIAMLIAGLGLTAALFSSGAIGTGDQSRWKGSVVLAGLGLA